MTSRLSVICPVFFSFRGKELFSRAARVLELFSNSRTEIIFVLGRTGNRLDETFTSAFSRRGARLICRDYTDALPSPGELRHIGAEHADNELLLFWDIDLVATADIIPRAEQHPFFTTYGFLVIPCLYMNASFSGNLPLEKLPEDLSTLFFDKALYVALNTSTVLISREIYQKSGGFQKVFLGHGFEDFDFLCNLARNICRLPIADAEFASYEKTFSPLFYTDFRRHLNKLTIPVFLDGIFSLHIFHPIAKKFLQQRPRNYAIFLDANVQSEEHLSESEKNTAIIDNIRFFLQEVEKRQLPLKRYTFLFNSIDHSMFLRRPFWQKMYRKTRKFLQPYLVRGVLRKL